MTMEELGLEDIVKYLSDQYPAPAHAPEWHAQDVLADVLQDLLNFAALRGLDFEAALARAMRSWPTLAYPLPLLRRRIR
jgi:hypothetical protein